MGSRVSSTCEKFRFSTADDNISSIDSVPENGTTVNQPVSQLSPGEARKRHREIEAQIEIDKVKDLAIVKVLLLGGPSSGKTTIFKQMRILHLDGFTESDYVNYRYIIHSNAVAGLQGVIDAAGHLGLELSQSLLEDAAEFAGFASRESPGNHEIDEGIGAIMERLWLSQPVQEAFRRRWEFNFLECTEHYLSDIQRLAQGDYRPSVEDILLARFRTTGIYEMTFEFKDITLRMVDVGGQKSEQKKWIHCFDNVQMLLFVASLVDYDLHLEEEPNMNRMLHSITILSNLSSSPYFRTSSFILFLNKKDVFEQKILSSPLKVCFPMYEGGQDSGVAGTFIRDAFVNGMEHESRDRLYIHFTNATDTANVDRVFDSCMEQILRHNMASTGVG